MSGPAAAAAGRRRRHRRPGRGGSAAPQVGQMVPWSSPVAVVAVVPADGGLAALGELLRRRGAGAGVMPGGDQAGRPQGRQAARRAAVAGPYRARCGERPGGPGPGRGGLSRPSSRRSVRHSCPARSGVVDPGPARTRRAVSRPLRAGPGPAGTTRAPRHSGAPRWGCRSRLGTLI